jgi:ATP-binding cassette, subfamily B, multidrug efflux pump
VRPYLLAVTLFTAAIGAFEALLFSMMAHVVDVLARCRRRSCGPSTAAR